MPCKCCLSKKHFLVFQARGLRSQSADAGVTANMEKIQVYIIFHYYKLDINTLWFRGETTA